jgi:ABC-type methionine transport system ATPase subunit
VVDNLTIPAAEGRHRPRAGHGTRGDAFFDEVTSALDPELVKGVLNLMAELGWRGMTMIVVTHEMGFARKVADQAVFMDDGKVVEAGTPRGIFENPKSPRLRRFLSEVAVGGISARYLRTPPREVARSRRVRGTYSEA